MRSLLLTFLIMTLNISASAMTESRVAIIPDQERIVELSQPTIKSMAVWLSIGGDWQVVEAPIGSTVSQVVESVAEVDYGFVCYDKSDIVGINGRVADIANGTYWSILVNGDSQHYSARSPLSPGDRVEFVWTSQKPHLSLSKWLLYAEEGR